MSSYINPSQQIDQNKQAQQGEQADKSAVAQELKQIAELKDYEKLLEKKGDEKTIDRAKHDTKTGKAQKDRGTKVLADLAKDLASLGMDFTQKAASKFQPSKMGDELDKLLEKKTGKEDKYEATKTITREAIKRSQGKSEEHKEQEKHKEDLKQLVNTSDIKETVQNYSTAYVQFLASTPGAKEKLEDAQDRLRKKGFSEKDMISLERTAKRSFGKQFLTNIQDSFMEHMFSAKNSMDFAISARKFGTALKEGVETGAISGDKEALHGRMTQIRESTISELKDFIRDAVESKLMEKHINDVDNKAQLKKLVDLGNKVGFNFDQFMKTWEQKKFDLGLFMIEVANAENPEYNGQIAIGDVSAGGVGEKHGYEMTDDEEKELLINQLRAEFMKKALTGDPFAAFTFAPKIRKLKNGLIKLGLELEEFGKIEKQAKALARYRLLENLKEAFLERATYYELTGPSYGLLENKLKGIISSLDKMDLKLGKEELDMVRDEANRQMHDHTIIELKSAMAILESGENVSLEKKVPLMVKLISRLKQESGFQHELGENLDEILNKFESGQKRVKEGA